MNKNTILNKTINKLEKLEDKQLNKRNKCRETKCSEINKQRKEENKKFVKEQDKVCNQKNSDKYYDCTVKFYENSRLEELDNKFRECGNLKCAKEKKVLNEIRDSILSLYVIKPEILTKKLKQINKKINKLFNK